MSDTGHSPRQQLSAVSGVSNRAWPAFLYAFVSPRTGSVRVNAPFTDILNSCLSWGILQVFFVINQRSSEFVGFGACLMLGMGTIHQTA